jgi:hypothetical protein
MKRASGLRTLIGRIRALWVPVQDVRAETWALGARHRGQVLEGARSEASTPGLSFRRAMLLRAVIRSQTVRAKALARAARG